MFKRKTILGITLLFLGSMILQTDIGPERIFESEEEKIQANMKSTSKKKARR